MISWVTIPWYAKYGPEEKHYFGVRYWDGIDKPVYTKIFEITKEERALRSGRFKNFVYFNFNERCTFTRVEIQAEEFVSMFYWMFDNMESKWACDPYFFFGDPVIIHFWFKEDTDATAFKLRWL